MTDDKHAKIEYLRQHGWIVEKTDPFVPRRFADPHVTAGDLWARPKDGVFGLCLDCATSLTVAYGPLAHREQPC